ncbi:MAG TPA: hypothetical protein PLZ93_00505 [Nocardioides sp.]|uniref:hypothetical protein n=1 Tax=uncultured Nocardioides sp. TaxID=198441 RepID=UPI002631CDC2|nr:hypothetical protein [uncultured Nocardioides sp.]HRD60454.1 hypothetical protein [Nocardioides sp.]HRI94073.1 hypothetical protein [Nocardioides sp.]HRK44120.1 hypothetical protein [Nocardioides sp.]
MSAVRDRRQRIVECALNSGDLTYREKLFMVVIATIAPEYVAGKRRHGSKAMGPDGKFALHLDYLGRALATSAGNVKKLRRACQEKGHLGPVHEGTFGRPSTWQAFPVRGDKTCGVTYGQIVPPYVSEDPITRGDAAAPLVYRTPDQGDHAPEPGGIEPAPIESKDAWRSEVAPSSSWRQFDPERDTRDSA